MKKFTKRLTVWLTPDELKALEDRASEQSLSTSALTRMLAMRALKWDVIL